MNESDDTLRIAQIMGKWVGGGVESVVMNYYRKIDKNKIQFDFICDNDSTNIPYEEIEKLGGKVILIPPYQKIFKYHNCLKDVFRKGNYKIVHSHINTLSIFPLFTAKCMGIPVRIAHSHSTTNKKEIKKNLLKQFLRIFSKIFATDYFACTEHAGRWLFGKKENFYILNNAIDVEKFKYDKCVREDKRKELGISSDKIVIGHVGRFVEQKNHRFIIDIFNEVYKQNNNAILLLVGQGPLMNEIKEKVVNLGLKDGVKFLGQRNDVNELYQAFDIFLFPSLYEGLGMAVIEAQCAECYCVVSTEVPRVAKVTNNIDFIDLSKGKKEYSNKILSKSVEKYQNNLEEISNCGYNIDLEVKKLEEKYQNLVKGEI